MFRPCLLGRAAAAGLALFTVIVAFSACGGSGGNESSTTTSRPAGVALTERESVLVAQMLFRNYQSGGATVAAAVDYTPQLRVAVAGQVDWQPHAGDLTVTSTFADGRPQQVQRVVFTEDAVYTELSPERSAALADQGQPGVRWTVRAPDVEGRPLDQVIELLVGLAATRPDNPQLVLQGGIRFDRRERVDGQTAIVFSNTAQGSSYWVIPGSGDLVRFQGTLAGFSGPISIDLGDRGPREVEIPAEGEVVDEAQAGTQPG
ncbi:MAG TPA: hypothetical protein PKA98_00035 [Acidimicrobiales bacterium]|nr:hypothetical protein [Acidimicrobiales bacterium]